MIEMIIDKGLGFLPKLIHWVFGRFGNLRISLTFKIGKRKSLLNNYSTQDYILQLKVLKEGFKDIRIDEVKLETDSNDIINQYIQFKTFERLKLEKDDFQSEDFVFNDGNALCQYLQLFSIRAKIVDTRNRIYYSDWVNFKEIKDCLNIFEVD